MTKVTITQSEYEKMQRQLSKLHALEAGGVDNWEWYDESLTEWRKNCELFELADFFVDDMNDLSVDADVDYLAGLGAGPSVMMPQNEMRELFLTYIKKYEEIKGEKT